MIAEETIKSTIEGLLRDAGLIPFVYLDRSQFLVFDMLDEIFVELVLKDDTQRPKATRLLEDVTERPEFASKRFQTIVRSIWMIESTGTTEIARSPDGGIRAAVIVPVTLRAGSAIAVVHVAVSWLAIEELKRIMGRDPDLRHLASAYVESQLKPGGQGYWDPTSYTYLEIGSEMALALYRMLKKTA